jgi:inorganic pyrophosphatase
MEDEQGHDDTIICVPCADPACNDTDDLDDPPQQLRDEISQFFRTYNDLEPDKSSRFRGE